ncbi:HAD family hydrolase [Conexibacter woesei]|uniref:Putative nonspecific acid phosphatase n=1 Tax=Conexibacter woesei (strain DSM 14684 / CCUG 47730 / CIP 108061 / JCM 11494 / NBRC 100937 / ID131577) TaxID=469383 RepID=D3EZX7_CONWI|nr:HAD family hydrolase [Conexibacter woesei]ADB49953.1 putative nonspecific acid phosphatase [Conexibacter woesei DSM 14684]
MQDDPLPSWQDTATRAAIVAFVEAAAGDGAGHVAPQERVAVFDNDGTLWCEKPIPIQLDFVLRRFAAMAQDNPALRGRQPWKAAREHDGAWLSGALVKHYDGDDADLRLLLGGVLEAFGEMTVDAYAEEVAAFLATASHPSLKRPYRACAFRPMVELLRYLEGHGFATYIASGGDRDFMRPAAEALYAIPRERVIGSSFALRYDAPTGSGGAGGAVVYKRGLDFLDDGPEKPVRIWSRVGRRPLVAVGNSNGDVPMLEFAGGAELPALRLVLRHDDAEREFAYDDGAEQVLARVARGAQDGWHAISMRDDWADVFGDAPGPS